MSDTACIDQYRLGFPAYRVFVYGVELSEDVFSVNMTSHDQASPNTCSISLSNEKDQFTVTTGDIIALDPWNAGLEWEKIKIPWISKDMSPSLENDRYFAGIMPAKKSSILKRKGLIKQTVSNDLREDPFGDPITAKFSNYFGDAVSKYPISDGCSIFHSMDPVRVFWRDPFNPSDWYHMFCGFVSDITETVDANNVKIMTLLVEDPTKLFRYTRTVYNPGILDAAKVLQNEDMKLTSFWTQPFHDMTLLEMFYTILFGPEKAGTSSKFKQTSDSLSGKTESTTRIRGIGHFSFDKSVVATVGPDNGNSQSKDGAASKDGSTTLSTKEIINLGNDLSSWQLMLDHKVLPTDVYMMATDDDTTNISEMSRRVSKIKDAQGNTNIIELISLIGSRPDQYPVDGGRIMILIPRSMGVNNNDIMLKDIIQAYPLNSEFVSAGQRLAEVVERIQFCMYCSPRGDIVVEPPLNDFNPDDFGMDELNVSQVVGSIGYSELQDALSLFKEDITCGPYGKNFVILKRDTYSWDAGQIDEKIYTLAVAKKALIANWDALGFSDMLGDLVVAVRPDLIPLYGVRQAPLTPRGYIYNNKAARLYAEICLNKLNADAHTFHVSHLPNIKLWLNRPVYIQGRNLLATTKQINHSITWGASGDMTTGSDLNATRTWTGQIDNDGNLIYTTINGYGAKLLNYAILFGKAAVPTTKIPNGNSTNADTSYNITIGSYNSKLED
jgi:hypothetical protein